MKTLFAGLLLAALPLQAGLFSSDFDSRKGGVVIRVVRPAERYLNGKTMRIKIATAPKSFTRNTELLAAVERGLSTQFVRADGGDADLLFEVDIVAYEPPAVRQYEVNEKRKIQVGERPLYNKDGTPKKGLFGGQTTQAIYEEQFVPIGYWEGKGRLAVRLSASSRGSRASIDSVTATAEFSEKKKISDPAPESSLADLGRMIGLGKKASEESLQTAEGLDLQFIEQVSSKTCSRFARTVNETPMVLSTEPGLVGGTALAQAGDWSAAIETWDKSTAKSPKNDWMRQFNLGLGHVALAFQTYDQGQDASQAAAYFERGGQLLLKAAAAKPNEKHIKDALQLYGSFKSSMQNIASETAAREENEKRALAEIAAQREKTFRDSRPDSPKETAFRQLVAVRLRGAKGALPAQERTDLEATGHKGYGLTALEAQRVVFQENDRIESAATAVGTYEDTFSALVEDGVLSTEERGVLQDLARNLSIPKSSLDAIHKRYTFEEPPRPEPKSANSRSSKSGSGKRQQ